MKQVDLVLPPVELANGPPSRFGVPPKCRRVRLDPAYWGSLSSRNHEEHVSDVVLDLMSHDSADVVQRQRPLFRMSQCHRG